ncbi:capsular polysaccharide synthesis protein [Olsenella profusa]|uniref:Capsular polysaccharide synthesis protein n=1 Tax=Olsenella profusa TaxID=138595 RepID=A0ABS2F3A5_9ACTN|nr:capsular polysaccharide synthesis protein [Olsenella profusa]MBM6775479.1 capsular polysaccharide synthesis protein [Olsenella profusa]
MANGHNSIRRLVHRTAEEVKASAVIGSRCGVAEGINAFRAKLDLQVMNRNGYKEPPAVKNRLMRKHEAVMTYLEQLLGDYARAYDYRAPLPEVPSNLRNKIWMCWWQGIDNAPEIVKACVSSVQRHSAGREVIIITSDNVNDYASIPEWFLDKVNSGVISRTHLSDLLRFSLLAQYGGIWLDATFYCCRDLSSPVYSAPVFSIKRPDYLHGSIASGYFANYSLGCDDAHRGVFAAFRDFFLEYWRRNDYLIDYLLSDYLIVLAGRHDERAKDSIAAIEPNNPMCDELFKILGDTYDEKKWHCLSESTDLFKLTWKQEFPISALGGETFFAALIKGGLDG